MSKLADYFGLGGTHSRMIALRKSLADKLGALGLATLDEGISAILSERERAEKAEQRCAALEAVLRIVADVTTQRIYASDGDLLIALERKATASLSGDTSALTDMLERAVEAGREQEAEDWEHGLSPVRGMSNANIAKRVREGR